MSSALRPTLTDFGMIILFLGALVVIGGTLFLDNKDLKPTNTVGEVVGKYSYSNVAGWEINLNKGKQKIVTSTHLVHIRVGTKVVKNIQVSGELYAMMSEQDLFELEYTKTNLFKVTKVVNIIRRREYKE